MKIYKKIFKDNENTKSNLEKGIDMIKDLKKEVENLKK